MRTVKIEFIETNYNFQKPPMLPETEFMSYKQIFKIEPNFNYCSLAALCLHFLHYITLLSICRRHCNYD